MSRLVNSTQEIRPLKARRSLSNLFERKRSASKSDVVTMPIPTPTPIPRENLSLGTTRTRQLAPVDPLLRKSLALMDDELNALGIMKLPPSPRSPTNTELKNIELGIAGQALDYSETRSAGMDRLGSGKENNWSDETEQRRLSLSAFQLPAGRMSFAGFGDFTDSLGEDLALADYDTTPISYEPPAFRAQLAPILPPVSLKSANSFTSTISTSASTSEEHLNFSHHLTTSAANEYPSVARHFSTLSSNLSDFPAPPTSLKPRSTVSRRDRSSSLMGPSIVPSATVESALRPPLRTVASIHPPTNEDYIQEQKQDIAFSKLAEVVLADSGRGGMATQDRDTGLGLTVSNSDNSISSAASSMSSGPFLAYRAPAPKLQSSEAKQTSTPSSKTNSPNPPYQSTFEPIRAPNYLSGTGRSTETQSKSTLTFPTNSRERDSPSSLSVTLPSNQSPSASMMTKANSSPQPRAAHLGSPVLLSNSTFPGQSVGMSRSTSSNSSVSPRSNNDLYTASLAGLGLTGEYDMPLWQGPQDKPNSLPRRPPPASSPLALDKFPVNLPTPASTAKRGSFSILRRRKSEAILAPPMKEMRSVSEPIPALSTRSRRQSESESGDGKEKRKSRLSMFLPKRKEKVVPPMPISSPAVLVRRPLTVAIPPPSAFINTIPGPNQSQSRPPQPTRIDPRREDSNSTTSGRSEPLPSPSVLPSPVSANSSSYFPSIPRNTHEKASQLPQTPSSSVFQDQDEEVESLSQFDESKFDESKLSGSRSSSPSPFITRSPMIEPPETIDGTLEETESLKSATSSRPILRSVHSFSSFIFDGSSELHQRERTNSSNAESQGEIISTPEEMREKRTRELDFGDVSNGAFDAMEDRIVPVTPRRLEIRRPIAVSGIDLAKDSPSDISSGVSMSSGDYSRLPKSPSEENHVSIEDTESSFAGGEAIGMALDGAEMSVTGVEETSEDNKPLGAIPGALSMQKSLRGSIRDRNGKKRLESGSGKVDPFEFDKESIQKRSRQNSENSTISNASSMVKHFGHSMLPQTDESVVRRQGVTKSPSLPLDQFISDSVLTMDLPSAPIVESVTIHPLRIRTRTATTPPGSANVESHSMSRKPTTAETPISSVNALVRIQSEQSSSRTPSSSSHSIQVNNLKLISPTQASPLTSKSLSKQPSMEGPMGGRSRSSSKNRMEPQQPPSRTPTLNRKPSLSSSQLAANPSTSSLPPIASQHRIFINDHTKHIIISSTALTRCGDVVAEARNRKALVANGSSDSDGGYALWEIWRSLGVERPIREFELLGDVIKTWSHDSSNILIIRRTSLWPVLSSHLRPQAQQPRAGWVNIEIKRGKWSKRWLELRDGSLTHFKSEKLKDSVFLCNLASFDIFFVAPHTINQIKAPKPFAFAIKSALPSAHYENREEYCHFVSVKLEQDRDDWIKSVIEARNNFVRQRERDMVAATIPTPPNGPLYTQQSNSNHSQIVQPLSTSNLNSNSTSRSKSVSSRATNQPLLNMNSTAPPMTKVGLSLDSRLNSNSRVTPGGTNGVTASRPDAKEWATLGAEQRTEWLKSAEKNARQEKSAFITF